MSVFFLCVGCVKHPSQEIDMTLCHQIGNTLNGKIGEVDVSLERVEMVLGPVYGCASVMASRENCTESMLESLEPVLLDHSVANLNPLGSCQRAYGRRGTMHSMMLDFGKHWPLGAGQPQELLPGQPSIRITGIARKKGMKPVHFVIEAEIDSPNSGVQSLRIHRLDLELDSGRTLDIDWDVFSRLGFVDFESIMTESLNSGPQGGEILIKDQTHQAVVSLRNSMLSREVNVELKQ